MSRKLVIDFFAGGGGASEGLSQAIGRGPDIAINHDKEALEMHKANHPDSRHVLEDVFKANLRKLVGKRRTGLAWFSPDCRDFSRAKGGKPVSKGVRSLAWIVVKAAMQIKPEVIILENVREFEEWGPLIPRWACRHCPWKGTECQVVHKRDRHHCPQCNSRRINPTEDLVRDPKRKGLTFKKWTGRLRNLGYQVQYKTLDAADFGAPTHRKRLFLIARRDGKPIVWPQPTHAAPGKLDRYALFERPEPHRTAAEIIDWELPCLSIFATPEEAVAWANEHKRGIPKRPLKEKTLRRIALGIKRYVLESPKPFIVRADHGGDHFRGQPLDRPLATVAGDHWFGLVTPFLSGAGGSAYTGKPRPVDQPFSTVKCDNHHALVSPVLSKFHGQTDNESHCNRVDEPVRTLDTQNRFGLVTPFLARVAGPGSQRVEDSAEPVGEPLRTVMPREDRAVIAPTLIQTGYGEREGQAPRVPGLDKPLGTVVADGQKHALVAACLSKFYGTAVGQPVDQPAPTQPASGKHTALASAHLVKFRGDSDGQSVEQPLPTITSGAGAARPAGAAHALGLSAVYLAKHYGGVVGHQPDRPIGTVTARDHHSVAAANLIRINHGEKQWNGLNEPLCTVTSQGNKFGLVYAFLVKYFGTAIGQPADSPVGTLTQVDRYGLVKVEVAPGQFSDAVSIHVPGVGACIIADIALRMLRPRELARAQGFPDSYKLHGPTFCKSTDSQVAKIGNSVPPIMAKALALANYFVQRRRPVNYF